MSLDSSLVIFSIAASLSTTLLASLIPLSRAPCMVPKPSATVASPAKSRRGSELLGRGADRVSKCASSVMSVGKEIAPKQSGSSDQEWRRRRSGGGSPGSPVKRCSNHVISAMIYKKNVVGDVGRIELWTSVLTSLSSNWSTTLAPDPATQHTNRFGCPSTSEKPVTNLTHSCGSFLFLISSALQIKVIPPSPRAHQGRCHSKKRFAKWPFPIFWKASICA